MGNFYLKYPADTIQQLPGFQCQNLTTFSGGGDWSCLCSVRTDQTSDQFSHSGAAKSAQGGLAVSAGSVWSIRSDPSTVPDSSVLLVELLHSDPTRFNRN